jgi:hypothetical protein
VSNEVAWNLAWGTVFAVVGAPFAFNIARARDRYTTFLNRPDVPRFWRGYGRMNDPRYARAFGFLFFFGGVLIVGVAIVTMLGH